MPVEGWSSNSIFATVARTFRQVSVAKFKKVIKKLLSIVQPLICIKNFKYERFPFKK